MLRKMGAHKAKSRTQKSAPVSTAADKLARAIIEDFRAHFVPDGLLVHAGGAADKRTLASLGVADGAGSKMPDVVLYDRKRGLLFLVESITSHGLFDEKRRAELARLFARSKAGIVYVTAFPNRDAMVGHLERIDWETVAWAADEPSHLIHFNGTGVLGPRYDPTRNTNV
jgi:hypothetical protein